MRARVCRLENRLDKAMIKYNEAMSIRKTYEQILKRLKEERLSFENQLTVRFPQRGGGGVCTRGARGVLDESMTNGASTDPSPPSPLIFP